MNNIIEVKNLSKSFTSYKSGNKNNESLRDVIYKNLKLQDYSNKTEGGIFWALKDINFNVKCGEKLAILGNNGSGKTTLLKILGGITTHDSGTIKINGKVSCLLQSGTGFHPELSGRENIFLNGIILGMSKKEVCKHYDEIVEFSGVKEFIDMPIKHYSTGMQARLGFSVIAFFNSDIMLIDEGLASGDKNFISKAMSKLEDLSKTDKTIIFVSHDENLVSNFCSRSIVLDKGRVVI